MWSAILGVLSGGLKLINKLLPSWEWKGGEAAAEAKAAKKGVKDARRAAEIDESVDHMSDDERAKWLRGDSDRS